MFLTFIIAFFSLIGLIVLHEFGHFILAKRFGVKVEEFGIGYPPRLIGKKLGETIYSLNLLPFGAFVKISGEMGEIEDYRSFIGKPMWQRVSIVLGGVVSFWLIAAIILSIVAGVWGLPTAVEDAENHNLINPKVQITAIAPDSPAEIAGLKVGDVIKELRITLDRAKQGTPQGVAYELRISKVKEVQEFTNLHKGEEIILTIKRGKESKEISLIPRVSPPAQEGPIGVGLARIALKPYLWYQAPLQGVLACGSLTSNVVQGWILGLKSVLGIAKLPPGVKMEMMGPLGIFDLLREYSELGINYFLFLVSLISVALALGNILPIPALDGGKLMFLAIEKIKGSPVNQKIEQNITTTCFVLLIILMIFVTIKFDIPRLF